MTTLQAFLRNQSNRTKHMASLVLVVFCFTFLFPLPAPAANPAESDTARLSASRSSGPQEAIWALALDPINPNVVYAGGKSGVFKSTDGGASWKNSGLRLVSALAINYTNPNIIFAGTDGNSFAPGASLWESTDGGTTWSDAGLIDWDVSLLVMDPVSPTTLYAGSWVRYAFEGGIVLWKTTDGGGSWDGSRDSHGGLASYGWAINPADPQTIYAPGDLYANGQIVDSGLFKSTDGGASWNGTRLVHASVSAVAIDSSNPDTLYAGTTKELYDLTFAGLLKSTDAGLSWSAINSGLSELFGTFSSISSLVIDPADPNTVYAGTRGGGVFRTSDGGASWSPLNPGLTDLEIYRLAINATGKHLYAATNLGVFTFQLSAPCAELLSDDKPSFDSGGGSGFVTVTAANECVWTVTSYADWITVSPDGSRSGSGTVSYTVSANRSASPRVGTVEIAARFLTVTQAGAPVRIIDLIVSRKKLLVTGEGFEPGAVILLNGKEQKTKNDDQNPNSILIGKKVGKKVKPGHRIQVRNPNGTLSEELTFTDS